MDPLAPPHPPARPSLPIRRTGLHHWTLCALTGLLLPLAPAAWLPAAEAANDVPPTPAAAPAAERKPIANPKIAAPTAQADPAAPPAVGGAGIATTPAPGPATGLPIAIPDNPSDATRPLPPYDPGPAPILIRADNATRQKALQLIHDLDSPASEIAARAFRDLVALDGGAVPAINTELLTQLQLRQRGSLNLQKRLREVLQAIALQIPDSYRRQMLESRRHDLTEKIRIMHDVIGRRETIHPTPAELKLEDIPQRLNLGNFDEILHLGGDWPARFVEKFLLAGGLAIDPAQFLAIGPNLPDETVSQLMARQLMLQRALQMQIAVQAQMDGSENETSVVNTLIQAPTAALRRIDGGFFLQWQELMHQLYPEPEVQAGVIAITRRGLIGRTDPAALDWALSTVRSALGDTINGAEPAPEELYQARQQETSPVSLAIEMLGHGGRPADLALLRDLAFRPETPWRPDALAALRLHWTDADIPRLAQLIAAANRGRDYFQLEETALSLENPALDAAVAARADWFGNEQLSWLLTRYVLQRGSPELIAAALKAWATEDRLDPAAQTIVVAFHKTEYYPLILKSIYSASNDRMNYDTSLSPAFYLLRQDPDSVKPWLYALNDIIGAGRKEYQNTPLYSQKLFNELQEEFKDVTNVNTVYVRTRILAEVRLLLVLAGDKPMEQVVVKTLKTPLNSSKLGQRDFEQLTLMWMCRILPAYPLPQLQGYLEKIDQRYYGGRIENNRQVYEPDQIRQELAQRFSQNQAFWYNRQMMVNSRRGRRRQIEQPMPLPPPALNYSYEPRIQAALQYHVPELALEALRLHPEDLRENPGLRMSIASTLGEIGAYAEATDLYESFLFDLPGKPARVAMHDDNDGSLHSVCNNLSWLYATALDPRWQKTERSVALAEEAVRMEPGVSYSIDTRAYAYLLAGRYEESRRDFEASARLLGLGNSDALASSLARQARALHGLQRDDDALTCLQQAVDQRPTDSETLLWIARGYGLLGRNDQALRFLAQAEAAGFMYYEQIEMCSDFDAIRQQRLYRNVLDNMQRHRKLIHDIVLEFTPVSLVPEDLEEPDPGPLMNAEEDVTASRSIYR